MKEKAGSITYPLSAVLFSRALLSVTSLSQSKVSSHSILTTDPQSVQQNSQGNTYQLGAPKGPKNQKVYEHRLTQVQRAEIVNLYQTGILVKGSKTIGTFYSLIYADTKKEAASVCTVCEQICSKSDTVRSTLYKHSNNHGTAENDNVQPPAYFKLQLTKCLAEMVSVDVLPFSVVEYLGFRNVLDVVFKTGFNLGKSAVKNKSSLENPSVVDYLPSRFTIKKFVGDFVSHVTPAFKAYVLKHVEDFGAALSMDFGTKESNYFACTVHFFNAEWELQSWTFNFNEYDEKTSDAEDVRKNLLSILGGYGISIDLVRTNIIITTDRGSNLLAALSDVTRVDDICHQLNILSKRSITPYKAQYITNQIQLSDAVKETLKTCDEYLKALTLIIKAIFARPELRKTLKTMGKSVKRHVETRWLSRFKSIESYIDLNESQRQLVYDELYDHRFNGRYIYRTALDTINDNLDFYQSYIDLMDPVNDAVNTLQGEKFPTINMVLFQYQRIKEVFEQMQSSDDITTRHMATSALGVLNYQQTVVTTNSEEHLLGLLLDPRKKDEIATCAPFVDVPGAVTIFRRRVKACNEPVAIQPVDPYDVGPPSPFAAHIAAEQPNNPVDPIDVEINKYVLLKSSQCSLQYKDATDFWAKQAGVYPNIAKLARRILCVTSSASSERLFSLLGRHVTKRRANLNTSTVSSLLSMKNLSKFWEIENLDMPEPENEEEGIEDGEADNATDEEDQEETSEHESDED